MGVVVSGERDVSGGQTDNDDIVLHGGFLVVSSGGKIINTTVDSGGETNSGFFNPGTVDVLSGATASATQLSGDETVQGVEIGGTVFSAGSMTIDGSASSVTIDGGGVTPTLDPPSFTSLGQAIFSGAGLMTVGGTATDTILDGGVQDILNNAFASGTTISNGGWEWVDGTDLSATVDSGSEQEVVGGGIAISTTLDTGAIQYVAGFASGTVISGGTQIDTGNGRSIGIVSGATVDNGGTQLVSDEGYADLTMVSSGTLMLGSEGIAANTTLSDGGTEYVSSGGNAFSTVIYSGGVQIVSSGGYGADQGPGDIQGSTTIYSGGMQYVSAGGTAFYTYLSGGTQYVAGVASDTTVDEGGTEFVEDDASNVSAVINDGGTIIVEAGGAEADTVEDDAPSQLAYMLVKTGASFSGGTISGGGIIELQTGAKISGAVTFAPDGNLNQGELVVDGTSPATLTVSNFVSGDTIQFANLNNLTLTAAFGVGPAHNGKAVAGEVDLYSGNSEVATLIFAGGADTYTLEPETEVGGVGTFVEVDTTSGQLTTSGTINDPQSDGSSIQWSFIHNYEDNNPQTSATGALSPFVPALGTSGVTVGYGVDLGNIGTAASIRAWFTSLFPLYASNPNLLFLYNSIGIKLPASVTYLKTHGGTVKYHFNPTSEAVSITPSQASTLTVAAEQFELDKVTSRWAGASPNISFGDLTSGAQTVLTDLTYHYGSVGPVTLKAFVNAAAKNTAAAWQAVINDVLHYSSDQSNSRQQGEANLLVDIVPNLTAQAPTSEQPVLIANVANYNFFGEQNEQYALDPNGAGIYTLLASAGAPDFSTLELPSNSAASYLVSYEIGPPGQKLKARSPIKP